ELEARDGEVDDLHRGRFFLGRAAIAGVELAQAACRLIYLLPKLINQMARASQARVEIAAPPAEEAEPVSRHRTLSRLAYERFKAALFERRIEAGAFMSQSELVALLGLPLGPVRDALQALQAEGLVTIRARSGIEITKADFALIRNTYQLRFMLERQAV